MVTELKEQQEKQVTPASREDTINRLDVIEQRISEMQSKSGITENTVQEILNQIGLRNFKLPKASPVMRSIL